MRFSYILLLLLLAAISQSIFLAVKPKVPRCMVEYITATGQVDTMKIMIGFPTFENPIEAEHFMVSIRNTETNITDTAIAQPGSKYLKEAVMDPSTSLTIQASSMTCALSSKQIELPTPSSNTMPSAPSMMSASFPWFQTTCLSGRISKKHTSQPPICPKQSKNT
jgi:hypothetical protein